jgi:hypothetical protein
MTCKYIHSFSKKDEWWRAFLERVIEYQKSLKVSKFLRSIESLQSLEAKQILALVFGRKCHCCKTKRDHYIFKALKLRVCISCLKNNLVSNGVLEFKYGISFSDFAEDYVASGGLLIPKDYFFTNCKTKGKEYEMFMMDEQLACESRQYASSNFSNMIFFWIPHLENIMKFDLKKLIMIQKERRKAAQFLSARMARRSVRILDTTNYLSIPKYWFPGNTLYCYGFDSLHTKSKTDLWWRKGFNIEKHRNINTLINNIYQNLILGKSEIEIQVNLL